MVLPVGESIVVGWTVENTGIGVTAADQWYDRVYWSDDQQIGKHSKDLSMFITIAAFIQAVSITNNFACQ